MFLFYLKKNFCDGWDNAGQLIIVNLILLVYTCAAFFLNALAGAWGNAFGLLVFTFTCGIFGILVTAYGEHAAAIASFETRPLRDYFSGIKNCAKDGFLFGCLCSIIFSACAIGIPGYLSMKSTFGFFLAVILFWVGVISALALQWFIPLRSIMHNNFKKCLKKCFIIFFDNTFFSILVGIYTLVMLPLSLFLFFLVPSAAGILLAQTNALRLRLYKYDYLEQHPELTKEEQKDIPWPELLEEDKECLGHRSLRSFIFPWKD